MGFLVAERWFEHRRIDDDVTLIWEPHVDPLIRCNIWHVRGGARDLLIDTGLGIASLKALIDDIFDKPVTVVATHSHYDHVGGLFEFEQRIAHRSEEAALAEPRMFSALLLDKMDPEVIRLIRETGYDLAGDLISALPHAGYDPSLYAVRAAPATQLVDEGDVIAAGARRFQVLHLPGHSPGSMGLWEAETGVLFSGDAIYDGPLIDNLPGGDVAAYAATLERLKRLGARVIHAGHDPSFDGARLDAIADVYLGKWRRDGLI